MNTYLMKCNYANLSKSVRIDYLRWLDCFHRVFTACLVIIENNKLVDLQHVCLENKLYDELYHRARQAYRLNEKLAVLGVLSDFDITLCTDMLPMVEDFIQFKYRSDRQNFFSLTIDDNFSVNIKLTTLVFPVRHQ